MMFACRVVELTTFSFQYLRLLLAVCLTLIWSVELTAQEGGSKPQVRIATFNVSMYRSKSNELIEELRDGSAEHPQKIAKILQVTRPDVVLLNEFDFDKEGEAARLFVENYLGVAQGDSEPIEYEYRFVAPVNTGVDSGFDLDRDGKKSGTMNDAFGFGRHAGQYGMLVLSRYPIDRDNVRTFQKFLWKDMPDHCWPVIPETNEPYYSEEIKRIFRLSSKSHWDVPVQIGEQVIHFLVSHPTPPVFDREEDKNGCRNHDEIRFWADYVSPSRSEYIYDDEGKRGGLAEGDCFVIAGDQNADPNDGDSRNSAARLLTEHDLIDNSFIPGSEGAVEAAEKSAGQNRSHKGNPGNDTGDFNDASVGNLRIDYVLPSKTLQVTDSGVFWPASSDPNYSLIQVSDHRMVWIDVRLK